MDPYTDCHPDANPQADRHTNSDKHANGNTDIYTVPKSIGHVNSDCNGFRHTAAY